MQRRALSDELQIMTCEAQIRYYETQTQTRINADEPSARNAEQRLNQQFHQSRHTYNQLG
uniref:Uncharacterized protein n=1 Tax=Romanomermis culicivorax TaxID=13658 RepID=A0A915IJJ8_ROMCU